MRMLSGRMHWLTVGLALLVSAQGFATKRLHGQAPPPGMAGQMPYGMPPGMGGVRPAGGMMSPDRPMSMAFEGPPPMDVTYASGTCDNSSGYGGGFPGGCSACGGTACGGMGCGPQAGGLGSRLGGRLASRLGVGCGACGGAGCGACGGGLGGRLAGNGNGCLGSGALFGLLGPLAPYSEGGQGSQRWFDFYAGTIGLSRTSNVGGFATSVQNRNTGEFLRSHLVSIDGANGNQVLRTSDLDLDNMRYGLELIGALQLGPGSNVEARYFGLNNWNVSRQAEIIPKTLPPTLFSSYSSFGADPAGGFDDTDRSYIHRISYSSELHNGEVNYRRRFVSPFASAQGSWLAGVRYFDLDERFGFNAIGATNNTFTFNELRFFNHETQARNQLTGFQLGGDYWVNVVPGLQLGVESKGGIFGNHATVESQITANSIPGAHEHLSEGRTAYLGELVASAVYRLSYSWSLKASYNLLYVDNVALAPENYNTRDLSNAIGGGAFTMNRQPFIDVDGEVVYQGWSIGGEYMW